MYAAGVATQVPMLADSYAALAQPAALLSAARARHPPERARPARSVQVRSDSVASIAHRPRLCISVLSGDARRRALGRQAHGLRLRRDRFVNF